MEGYQARAFPSMVPTKMDSSYKVDEGYSEDTRSQDDSDSPMRMETGGDDMLSAQAIVDTVIALNEGEKSGKQWQLFLTMLQLMVDLTDMRRNCV